MGSFFVGCAISNLAIGDNDRIGFMIIGKPKNYGDLYPDKPQRPFYTYNTDLYKPFLPPIFGQYADYGDIDRIRPSATTELIETMFHRPVKTVLDAIVCNRGVYSKHGQIMASYYSGDGYIFDGYKTPATETLLAVGFLSRGENSDGDTIFDFNDYTVAMHPRNFYTISNHVQGQTIKNKFYASSGYELLEYFGQVTGVYPGYDPEEYEAISLVDNLSGTYFLEDVYHEMVGFMEADIYMKRDLVKFDKDWTELMVKLESSEDLYYESCLISALTYIQRETVFPYSEQQKLLAYKDTDGFAPMNSLVTLMSSLNRMLIPSFCGEQCGNDRFSNALNVSTQKILDGRIAESEDWPEEDDPEDGDS